MTLGEREEGEEEKRGRAAHDNGGPIEGEKNEKVGAKKATSTIEHKFAVKRKNLRESRGGGGSLSSCFHCYYLLERSSCYRREAKHVR